MTKQEIKKFSLVTTPEEDGIFYIKNCSISGSYTICPLILNENYICHIGRENTTSSVQLVNTLDMCKETFSIGDWVWVDRDLSTITTISYFEYYVGEVGFHFANGNVRALFDFEIVGQENLLQVKKEFEKKINECNVYLEKLFGTQDIKYSEDRFLS